MKTLIFETDWLASRPFFYNAQTAKASENINDVIDYGNLEFDPEGFNNYLDFGYSILEQTPIRNVRYLRHSSRLWRNEHGRLEVEYLDDPVYSWMDHRLSESDIIDQLRARVQAWERRVQGDIVIPTSGGFDSRLLNWCIGDKERVRAFTYGISEDQAQSFEVLHARETAARLNIRWAHIPLGFFHRYLDDWYRLYGVATHAHGMYHIEFYKHIKRICGGGGPLLSGIVGDAWAGSLNPPAVVRPGALVSLGLTHGMRADPSASRLRASNELRRRYLHDTRALLSCTAGRIVELVRLKMILLSYLFRVPRAMGFQPWSPFLEIDLCLAMLNLPPKRREGRAWQREFFKKVGLDVEAVGGQASHGNTLNMQALRCMSVPSLNPTTLARLVDPHYTNSINAQLAASTSTRAKVGCTPWLFGKLQAGLKRLGYHSQLDRILAAYFAYLVLYPVQRVLVRPTHAG